MAGARVQPLYSVSALKDSLDRLGSHTQSGHLSTGALQCSTGVKH